MFSKKLHADVKKSTQKIQDLKKDSATRFKHLRIVLENVDTDEAKCFFEANYSHIYYIFYDNFIIAETNLKQKVHKAHKEELEAVLLMLDKILTLCPELLSKRWQCHSLTRLMTKLLHPGNSWKLRREAIRYFILWYQALGDNSPDSIHAIFATLVPGFSSPISDHLGLTGLVNSPSATVFHDFQHGPISSVEIQAVFLPQSGEKQPDDPMRFFLDALLEFIVTQVPRVEWRDKGYKQHKSFMFLFDKIKQYYLPHIFPSFSQATSLYKPVLDLNLLRPRFMSDEKKRQELYMNCRVTFIKWIANFTHTSKNKEPTSQFARSTSLTPNESEGERSPGSDLRRVSVGAGVTFAGPSGNLTSGAGADDPSSVAPFTPSSDSSQSEDPNLAAFHIVREVLYSTRDNVNLIHEVYRQAFLLNFNYSPAIRRAITVYKDWIQMNVPELPPFMLEPLEGQRSSGPSSSDYSSMENPSTTEENVRLTRLRNDSYIGAIQKENLLVRAGLQNVLQVFITHAANVFLLEILPEYPIVLEEQVDTCKRVLNIYRYMVMHTHMESRTWEQLLLVLLQITSLILSKTPPKHKEETLGGKLAPAIFQTLIVTWIKANLNVVISTELWDQFLAVLSSLTQWEELIREWSKTLETLTRVLARHVYSLDLTDLPLDRLSEQKSKRQRRSGPVRGSTNDGSRDRDSPPETKSSTDTSIETENAGVSKNEENWPVLRKSASESNLISATKRSHRLRNHRHQRNHSNTVTIPVLSQTVEQELSRMLSGNRSSPRQRLPRKSLSLESLRDTRKNLNNGYCESEGPSRSPSPAPSSGVESNSFKDSPMQLDMLSNEGANTDLLDGERRSVMSGGTVRGWLPDVAVVLWRRMLGALGDINNIRDPNLHAQVLQYLVELTDTMSKTDVLFGTTTFYPPVMDPSPTVSLSPGDQNRLNNGKRRKINVNKWKNKKRKGSRNAGQPYISKTKKPVPGKLPPRVIRHNQGIPGDNQATPNLPELVPPITIIAPWCFQALTLSDSYHKGKLFAYRLLCQMTVTTHDVPLEAGLLSQFYKVLHQGLISTEQSVVNTLVRYCGPRFFSLQLPGFSLLLLDFIHATNSIVSSHDFRTTPRSEAMSILGGLLSFPQSITQLPVLQPTSKEFIAKPCPEIREHVVKILLRSGKTEGAGIARCIALSSLGLFAYQELTQASSRQTHPKIKEAINTLLLALRFNHKTVAQIASDILLVLCDHAQILLRHFPEIPPTIVEVLAGTLSHLMPVGDSDKRLLTSLVFCLGEWTMRLPSHILLAKKNKSCLLHSIFKVLTELSEGSKVKGSAPLGGLFHPEFLQEFNPNISLDNLKQEDASPAITRRISGNSPPHLNSPGHSIQLAAKMVILHLLNHLGHFPLAIGAARLCSLVIEQDDVPGLTADTLSAEVFSAPNIQLFVMSSNLLMSLVELPTLEVPGGGVTAGLVTAPSQVRLILRDLAGKASWDASILYCTPEQYTQAERREGVDRFLPNNRIEESMLNSCMVGNVPQHTLRHRSPQLLPTFENSADDLDNLDDLLQYIGETSPECLENLDTPRNIPPPPLNSELEQEAMGSVLNQRFLEQDFSNRNASQPTMQVKCTKRVESKPPATSFQHCRLLFSQLGLAGWERRSQLHLLDKNEKLLRELRNLDTQRCRETHKIAVIYVAEGQEDKNSILSNTSGSQTYEEFISGLAWEVELESHTGFMGGLQRNKTTGVTAPYYATSFTEVIFHVSTRMPCSNTEALLQKTRHLGNDEVHIVWSEHSRDYRRGIIPTEFCDVLIVIYPLPHKLFRIQVSRKSEVPYFGPLFNEAIVGQHVLAGLVRATAISASRAKRSMLPFYQQYYEERSRSLETVMRNHKNASTFEEFAAQVYSPVQTPSPFCQGPNRASGVSCRSVEGSSCPQVTNSTTLAAALIDSHTTSTHNMRGRLATDASRLRVAEGGRVWFMGGDGDQHQHGISPRPLKKLALKTGPKRMAPSLTPPDSPTSRRSK